MSKNSGNKLNKLYKWFWHAGWAYATGVRRLYPMVGGRGPYKQQ